MAPAPHLNLPGFLPPHKPIPPPSPASTLSALQASFPSNQCDISPTCPDSFSLGYPIQHPPPTQSSPNVILAFIFLGGISGIALLFTIRLIYRSYTSESRRRDTLSLYFEQEAQRRRTVESCRIYLTRPEQERICDAQQVQSQSQSQDRSEAMRHQGQEAMEQETIRQDREEALRRLEGLGSPPAVFSQHDFQNFISEIDRAREDRRREALQKAQQQPPPPPYSPFPGNEHSFIQAPLFPNLAAPQQVYLRDGAGEGPSLQDRRSGFWSSEAYVEEVEAQRAAEPLVPSTPSSKFGLVLTWFRDHIPAFLKKPTATSTQNGAAKNFQLGTALSQNHGREEGNATAKKGSVSVAEIKPWIEERIDKSKKIEHEREATLRRLEGRN